MSGLLVRNAQSAKDRVPPKGPRVDLQARTRRAMMAPLVLFLLLLTIYPVVFALITSLTDEDGTFGLMNYAQLVADPVFRRAVLITMVFTVLAVAGELTLGLIAALVLFDLRGENRLIRALLILPMAATPVAVLFGWKVILDPVLGVLNWMLDDVLGLGHPNWLGEPALALATLIGVDVWQWTPFVMIILFGGLTAVSGEAIEASLIDGAGWWGRMWHVIIPALRPFLIVALLFRGVDALKTFDSIQILTGGGPGTSTTTLNMYAFKHGIEFLDFGVGSAAAIILLIIAILFGNIATRLMSKEVYS